MMISTDSVEALARDAHTRRQTDRQTNRQTDTQTDTQTHTHTHTHTLTYIHAHTQTVRYTHRQVDKVWSIVNFSAIVAYDCANKKLLEVI